MRKADTEQIIRCKALYDFLLRRGGEWTSTIDVCDSLLEYYPFVTWLCSSAGGDFHDSNARLMITNDIRYINQSEAFEKLVISGKKGIKIASEEEADRYLKNQKAAALRKLGRLSVLMKKANLNNQMVMGHTEAIEAFLKEENA